ncbi:MAG TPA: LysM peptidoglycan-binding domain-containing protein [Longimicrobiales bacterium]|nr:LysM peptidoglycan-binding domain-containing protein [Longimicrobiales bacterium]
MSTYLHGARLRLALTLMLMLGAAAAASAQQTPQPETQQQREHVVRAGDTLWDLARAYLMNGFLWPMIYEANRNVVENPHRIFPGERLIIPALQPQAPAVPLGVPVVEQPVPVQPVLEPEPVAAPKDTATVIATLDLRRPVVPLAEYLSAPWLSTTARAEVVGRIVRLVDPTSSADRLPSTLHPNERVLVGALAGASRPGDTLVIVRFGRTIGRYGTLVEPLGLLRVDSVSATVITAQIVRQYGDAKIGDVVMPMGKPPLIGLGEGEPVAGGSEGQLLQFLVPEPLHGTADVAFISLGHDAGIGIGDDFSVYVPERAIDNERAERLPPTQIGTLRVIRVGQHSATVRVLSVNNVGLQAGLPVRLIRKMP